MEPYSKVTKQKPFRTKKNSNTYSKVAKPCDIPSTCRISYFLM